MMIDDDLNKEELGFSSKARTTVGCERLPHLCHHFDHGGGGGDHGGGGGDHGGGGGQS